MRMNVFFRKLAKMLIWALVCSLLLLVIIVSVIQIPYFQNILVDKATTILKDKTGLDVSIGSMRLDLKTKLHLNKVLLKDYVGDTLIYIEDLQSGYSLGYHPKFEILDKNIVIEGAYINLSNTRADSILNITKTFSPKQNKKTKNKQDSIQSRSKDPHFLSFQAIDMKDVHLRFRDSYNYKRIYVDVEHLNLKANNLKLSDSIWKLQLLSIANPYVQLVDEISPYMPKNLKPEFLALPFKIDVDRLELMDGHLKVRDERQPLVGKSKLLSFSDLDVQSINLDVEKVELRKASIKGHVNHLRAKEKSGLTIQELTTDFTMTSFKMLAKNLHFKTKESEMKGNLRFEYRHMREYLQFAKRVRVISDMKKSTLSLSDLALFTESLQPFSHLKLTFETHADGTMNTLNLSGLKAKLNQDRLMAIGQVYVQDLFVPGKLHIKSNLNALSFDKKDIDFLFQKNLPSEVSNLGRMNYSGTFQGNPTVFTLNGGLKTEQGSVQLNHTEWNLTDLKKIKYSGNYVLHDLKLSRIAPSIDFIQSISANMDVDGQGFDVKNINTRLNGKLRHIAIKGSNYENVVIDGSFIDKVFVGKINSLDPDLLVSADGKIDLKDHMTPDLNLDCRLTNIDLYKLNFTTKPYLLNARIQAIGKGQSIQDILGAIFVKDLNFIDKLGGKTYALSDLTIEKNITETGNHSIEVNSNEVQATLVGKYHLKDIPSLLKEYLIDYIAVDHDDVVQSYHNTYFYLSAQLKDVKNYAKLFQTDIKNIESGDVRMRFDGTNSKLKLDGTIKGLSYQQFRVPEIILKNESTNGGMLANIELDSVYFQNKLGITPLKFFVSNVANGLRISAELLDRKDEKFVDFNTIIKKEENELIFRILPFNSYYGRKVWALNPDNIVRINMDNQSISVQDLEIQKDNQIIRIKDKGDLLNVFFKDVKLEELISGFLPILRSFKGELNGEIDIANVLTKPTPIGNLKIRHIMFDNEKIGSLDVKSSFQDEVLYSDIFLFGERVRMRANGQYNSKTGVDSLSAKAIIEKLDLSFLNKYLNELVYEMKGSIRADLDFQGSFDKMKTNGTVFIDTMSTYIQNIRTQYTTNNQTIYVLPNKIVLNDLEFRDEYSNKALANGLISHQYFTNFFLNITATTPKLFCLNTTSLDNQNFYGQVFARANMNFNGFIGQRITLKADGQNLPNSHLYIAFTNTQNIDRYSFYEFIPKAGKSDTSEQIKNKKSGVNFDFNFDINDQGKLTIVMDPAADDRIDCTGEGKIAFKLTPESDMNINGEYKISSGTYKFTYQNLFQRIFYLNKGGVMTFLGNPRLAKIDASATFKTRASAQDLILAFFGNNADVTIRNAARNQIKADVTLSLTDKIMQPIIKYKLNIQQNDPTIQAAFDAITTSTQNNENELNRQVIALLTLNRFFAPNFTGFENSQAGTSNFGTDASNAAIDIVSGKMSSYITDFVQNTFKGMNLNLGFNRYNQIEGSNISSTANFRNNLNLAISQKLLKDRVIFNIGGNYDFGRDNTTNLNTTFFGSDLDLEVLLSKYGNLRLKIYSTLNNDPFNAKYINKTGAGIQFQREFEEFKNIFDRNNKLKIEE